MPWILWQYWSHFEEGKYYRDTYVVSLNIIQTYLARQSYSDAVPYLWTWDSWGKTVEGKDVVIGEALYMRYYQFRVITVLGIKGRESGSNLYSWSNAYYFKNKESISQEGWFGYKIMCSQILGNIGNAVAYMDSLIDYQRSIGNYYPGNYRQKSHYAGTDRTLQGGMSLFWEYSQLNDSVRTAEMDEQLNKYTAQFEVDRLKMEKLELSEKMSRERLAFVFGAGCVILLLLILVTYLYIRTLSMNRKLDVARKELQKMGRIKGCSSSTSRMSYAHRSIL